MVDKAPGPVPFEQESTLFRSISEKMNEAYCEVYAPIKWDTATERKKVCLGIQRGIFDCINDNCGTEKAEKGAKK